MQLIWSGLETRAPAVAWRHQLRLCSV